MSALASPSPGWWGKLPALGDFASRRLPPAFVQRWDDWLQRGLAACREGLGEAWLQAYLVAPIVRFVLAPGALGPQGWAGVVMPSVDRVDRHFPLTLAAATDGPADPVGCAGWFDALDEAARGVLSLHCGVDDLEQVLSRLPPAPPATAAASAPPLDTGQSRWWCAGFERHARRFDGLPPPEAVVELLERTLREETWP